jgi:hypothetical protein
LHLGQWDGRRAADEEDLDHRLISVRGSLFQLFVVIVDVAPDLVAVHGCSA